MFILTERVTHLAHAQCCRSQCNAIVSRFHCALQQEQVEAASTVLATAICAHIDIRDEALRHGILSAIASSPALCDDQRIHRALHCLPALRIARSALLRLTAQVSVGLAASVCTLWLEILAVHGAGPRAVAALLMALLQRYEILHGAAAFEMVPLEQVWRSEFSNCVPIMLSTAPGLRAFKRASHHHMTLPQLPYISAHDASVEMRVAQLKLSDELQSNTYPSTCYATMQRCNDEHGSRCDTGAVGAAAAGEAAGVAGAGCRGRRRPRPRLRRQGWLPGARPGVTSEFHDFELSETSPRSHSCPVLRLSVLLCAGGSALFQRAAVAADAVLVFAHFDDKVNVFRRRCWMRASCRASFSCCTTKMRSALVAHVPTSCAEHPINALALCCTTFRLREPSSEHVVQAVRMAAARMVGRLATGAARNACRVAAAGALQALPQLLTRSNCLTMRCSLRAHGMHATCVPPSEQAWRAHRAARAYQIA